MNDNDRATLSLALAILAATPDEWGRIEALSGLLEAGLVRQHADGRWERTGAGKRAVERAAQAISGNYAGRDYDAGIKEGKRLAFNSISEHITEMEDARDIAGGASMKIGDWIEEQRKAAGLPT